PAGRRPAQTARPGPQRAGLEARRERGQAQGRAGQAAHRGTRRLRHGTGAEARHRSAEGQGRPARGRAGRTGRTGPLEPRAVVAPPAPLVLVVDDEASVRQALERALRLEGFAVETAAGGREAIEAVSRRPPAVVVLDVTMPDLDGV